MNRNALIRAVVIPLILSLLLVLAVREYVDMRTEEARRATETAQVVVAVATLPPRTVLTEDLLALRTVPRSFVTADMVQRVEDAVGRTTVVPLAAGDVIFSSKLAGENELSGLSFHLPPGKRALTIYVNEVIGAGGFVQPGDYVDVLATLGRDVVGSDMTVMVAQDVMVMAVGRRTEVGDGRELDPEAYSSVTLAVTPQEAGLITFGEEKGTLRLVLRGATETEQLESLMVDATEFAGGIPLVQKDQSHKIRLDSPNEQVRFYVTLLEVDRDQLGAFGLQPGHGVVIAEVNTIPVKGLIAALVDQGKARVFETSDLITMHNEEVTYSLGGTLELDGESYPYGLTLRLKPFVHNVQLRDLTVDVQVKVLSAPPGEEPATDERGASGTITFGDWESIIVGGLYLPADFTDYNHALPARFVTPALRQGERELLLHIRMETDPR